jgi:predicted CopG family antitoxin
MSSTQSIFNRDFGTVTISQEEYEKLLQYKELCKEFQEVLQGDAE